MRKKWMLPKISSFVIQLCWNWGTQEMCAHKFNSPISAKFWCHKYFVVYSRTAKVSEPMLSMLKEEHSIILHTHACIIISVCIHFAGNPRCPVAAYKEYTDRHAPEMCASDSPFYLQKIVSPKSNIWYKRLSMGKNLIGSTCSRMCNQAGIKGSTLDTTPLYRRLPKWFRRQWHTEINWTQEYC